MRYPATEKLEIIRLVEQSPLPVRRTLAQLGIPRPTFTAGMTTTETAGRELERPLVAIAPRLEPHPAGVRDNLIQLALDEPALSPPELAVRFTDTQNYFVSEASVYRLLKAHSLIASISIFTGPHVRAEATRYAVQRYGTTFVARRLDR